MNPFQFPPGQNSKKNLFFVEVPLVKKVFSFSVFFLSFLTFFFFSFVLCSVPPTAHTFVVEIMFF